MLLLTTIIPRRDGTVTLRGAAGQVYVFKPDAAGDLVCEVDDEATLKHALRSSDFEPALIEDHEAAQALLDDGALPDEDDGEPPDEDEGSPNAPPLEAQTPPMPSASEAPRNGRKGKKA